MLKFLCQISKRILRKILYSNIINIRLDLLIVSIGNIKAKDKKCVPGVGKLKTKPRKQKQPTKD